MPTRCTAVVVAALAWPVVTAAEEPISLGEILAATTRNNPTLLKATVDVDIANAAVMEQMGIEDWLFAANAGTFLQRDEAVTNDLTGTDRFTIYNVGAEVSRLLATGGSIRISSANRRIATVFGLANGEESIEYESTLSASYFQPLLRGRGSHIFRAEQRRAKVNRDVAELARRSQALTIFRQVIHAYWDLAFAWKDLSIRKASVKLAQERKRITDGLIAQGATPPTEALAVEQTIATEQIGVAAAKLAVATRSLELRRIAQLEIDPSHVELATTEPLPPRPISVNERALLSTAFAQSPEVASLRGRERGATIDVEVTDNNLLPRLDFTLTAGPRGSRETPTSAIAAMARFKGYTVNGSLLFEQTIGRRSARAQKQRALDSRRRIRIDINEVEKQLSSALLGAVRQAQAASRQAVLATRTVSLARKNIEAESARFELGRATNFDVLQRQQELRRAQLSHAKASVDYLKAIATIDSLTAELFSRYDIELN